MRKTLVKIIIFTGIMFLFACNEEIFNEQRLSIQTLLDSEYTLENCYTNLPWYLDDYARCADVEERSGQLYIRSNSVPPHSRNFFPPDSMNFIEPASLPTGESLPSIREKLIEIIVPKKPLAREVSVDEEVDGIPGTSDNEYPAGVVGVAINGVALVSYDLTESDESIIMQVQDDYGGHVDGAGLYHYHSSSQGPLEVLKYNGKIKTAIVSQGEKELYGIMCDGTLVLGCTELNGREPDSHDFDAQNGHSHTILKKFGKSILKNRYHTHICLEKFPHWQQLPEIQHYSTCIVDIREFQDAPAP